MERRALIRPKRSIPRRALFIADWENGTYQKWAKGFILKNHWRVQHLMDKEDCLAEIALVFAVCHRKYYGKVHKPNHFMALFKTAVNNKWNTYAVTDANYRSMIDDTAHFDTTEPDDPASEYEQHLVAEPSEDAIGNLAVAVNELPAEAKLAMRCLLESPAELIAWLFAAPLDDETLDKRLRRLFRIRWPAPGQPHNIVTLLRGLVGLSC